MKILFITSQYPFPPDKGGKIVTFCHLNDLTYFSKVDLICNISEEDYRNVEESYIKEKYKINNIYLNEHWIMTSENKFRAVACLMKSLIKNIPYKVLKHYNKNFRDTLVKLLSSNKYDLIVLDQITSTVYLKYLPSKINKYILTHNAEWELCLNQIKDSTNIIEKLILKIESIKMRKYENRVYNEISKVLFLSNEDKNKIRIEQETKTDIYYSFIRHFRNMKIKNNWESTKNIFILGSMSWKPNYEGACKFIDTIWKELKNANKDLKLYIVGATPVKKLKKKVAKFKDIELTGRVENLDSFFDRCDLLIIPLYSGSGIKIKTIEALSRAMPTIITQKGVEGIDIEDKQGLKIVKDKRDFVRQCNLYLNDKHLRKDLSKNGNKWYLEKINSCSNKFLEDFIKDVF